jgi:hypothetical protein
LFLGAENEGKEENSSEYTYTYIRIPRKERKKERYSNGKKRPVLHLYVSQPRQIINDKLIDVLSREGRSISDWFFEQAERYVLVHSEGNPQLVLTKFTQDIEAKKTCFFCRGHFPTLKKVEFISGLIAPTCESCLAQKVAARTVKRVLGGA